MITTILLFSISVFFEGFIPNVLRNVTPFFMIAAILISSTYFKDQKRFYCLCFLFGVLYSVIYDSTVFLNGFIYVLIAFLSFKIVNKSKSFITYFLSYLLMVLLYVLIMILFTFTYNSYSLKKIRDILLDGLLINVIYFLFIYLIHFIINRIFGNRFKKHSY